MSDTQVVWLMVIAIITASFAVLDHALPNPVDTSKLSLWRTLYFLGWMAGLWLIAPWVAPCLLLKNQLPEDRSRNSVDVDLMAALAALALLSLVTSQVLIAITDWLHGFSRDRWLVNPSSLNVIASAIVVVAFLPMWRQEVCNYKRSVVAILWIVFFVVSATIYAGMYGPWFKSPNGFNWQIFSAYAAFPTVVMIVAFIAFLIPEKVGRFRWFVFPVGLTMGFAVVAQCNLASLPGALESRFLMIAHAVNGALLGLILTLWRESRRWWGGSYAGASDCQR